MGRLLDDSEIQLFDCIASELTELAGEEINYYGMANDEATIDPLYGEFVSRKVAGPFRIFAWLSWPQNRPDPSEQGFGEEWDGEVVISRSALDSVNAPYPHHGDVIEAWRTPYHDAVSQGKGMFFDIIQIQNEGHINDSPSFVQFRGKIKRRSEFGAERKITPP